MNRNKSLGITNNRGGNRINSNNRENSNLMRMNDFDSFDRMFNNFAMPRMSGGSGLSGLDQFFGNFQSISRGFRDIESDFFSK
jgi:hypothetical protein